MRDHRMGRAESKLDALMWGDLCEVAALLDLTPAELVASLLEVAREVKARGDPLQAFIDEEVARRLAAMPPPGRHDTQLVDAGRCTGLAHGQSVPRETLCFKISPRNLALSFSGGKRCKYRGSVSEGTYTPQTQVGRRCGGR